MLLILNLKRPHSKLSYNTVHACKLVGLLSQFLLMYLHENCDFLILVGGRLKRAATPSEIKHPVILCKNMHAATLILRYIHRLLGHTGRNHMFARLHQRYWIINANSASRKILSDCVACRRNRGKLLEQKMADLPQEMVAPDKTPF